jgi:hyaluronoglucosaminidase
MSQLGVVEGFFGPKWPDEARNSYANFLSRFGGGFYIYAPKQDQNLRKKWRESWSKEYIQRLKSLAETFQSSSVQFGIGFSPFGLGEELTSDDRRHLFEKMTIFNDLGINILGLFFDDMPTNENLAETQIEVLLSIKKIFKSQIVFCPSYYTPDPILDKVFGPRPAHYLEEIAAGIPKDVHIAWTGPKVISIELTRDHLVETTELLKRRPFLWENLYANDGPKNCKFLKLRPFSGRTKDILNQVEAFGLNMMNQPELSKILYLSSKFVLDGEDVEKAFLHSLDTLCSPQFKNFIELNKNIFLNLGLDSFKEEDKKNLLNELNTFPDLAAKEISDWLNGFYFVDSECLTD